MRPISEGMSLYEAFRLAGGFALAIIGMTYFVEPRRERLRFGFGFIFFSSGALFCFAALDTYLHMNTDVWIRILAVLFYILGLGIFELSYFLFGIDVRARSVRRTWIVGAVWTAFICFLPFGDTIFRIADGFNNIESSRRMGPCFFASYLAVYLMPLAALAWGWGSGMIRFPYENTGSRDFRIIRNIILFVLLSMVIMISGVVSSNRPLYRAGNILTILAVFAFHLYDTAQPELLSRLKREINEGRKRKMFLKEEELRRIDGAIKAFTGNGEDLLDPDFDLPSLARRINVSPHHLSYYFNTFLKTGFSTWHNEFRIDRAKHLLSDDQSMSVIDVVFACGFGSKAAFNQCFKKATGMTPTEYRKKINS